MKPLSNKAIIKAEKLEANLRSKRALPDTLAKLRNKEASKHVKEVTYEQMQGKFPAGLGLVDRTQYFAYVSGFTSGAEAMRAFMEEPYIGTHDVAYNKCKCSEMQAEMDKLVDACSNFKAGFDKGFPNSLNTIEARDAIFEALASYRAWKDKK